MADSTSFTVRFTDPGGAQAALWALASALHTAAAPRAVADDVRLAVELTLHDALVSDPGDGGVIAVAATPGRVAIEVRASSEAAGDPDRLDALVDEVTVTRERDLVVLGMARSWNGRTPRQR